MPPGTTDGSPAPAALETARKAAGCAGLDWHGTRKAAWRAVMAAKLPETGYTLRRAVSDAAHAVLARGLISEADFAALRGPWRQVTGETEPVTQPVLANTFPLSTGSPIPAGTAIPESLGTADGA